MHNLLFISEDTIYLIILIGYVGCDKVVYKRNNF